MLTLNLQKQKFCDMRNILLLIGVLLSGLFSLQNVFGADALKKTNWNPVKRSATIPNITVNEQVLLFHFDLPTENNSIQIYDQSGQLIFEDCFFDLVFSRLSNLTCRLFCG